MNDSLQQIDPRFAAAHYGNDLKPVIDIKDQLRTKTPNVWLMMRIAEEAAQHIATLESEAEQLRMSVHDPRIVELEAKIATMRTNADSIIASLAGEITNYKAQLAAHAALEVALKVACTSRDDKSIAGITDLQENPQTILDGVSK